MAIPEHIKELRQFIGSRIILAPSVTALVVTKIDEILVVRSRSDSTWTLPGGMVDLGETPYDAVIRETLEETGFWVHPISVLAILGGPNGFRREYSNGDLVEFVDTLFLCELQRRGRTELDNEVIETAFISATSLGGWSYPVPAATLLKSARSGQTIFGGNSGLIYAGQ